MEKPEFQQKQPYHKKLKLQQTDTEPGRNDACHARESA
jgi:hypothetical protein